jgi:RluA family pseudouridine synthase
MPLINSTFTSKVRNPGGATLLDYLARRFDYNTRDRWAELLSLGRMDLEGSLASGSEILREGQRLLFRVVDYEEPEVPLDWRVLPFEGPGPHPEDLMFVHKPAGLPVHRTGKIFFQTLANLVKEKLGDMTWSPLNRLDRETSGIVAFARGPKAFWKYAPSNPAVKWTKLYLAVVRGTLPDTGIGRIDQPLGELPGDVIRSRMHVHSGGKRALTLYQTLESRDGQSLVALSPITGRKHQLRAHLSWAGCPVVGDKIYSGGGKAYLARLERELAADDFAELGSEVHLLHSFRLDILPALGEASAALDFETISRLEWSGGVEKVRWWIDTDPGQTFISTSAKG